MPLTREKRSALWVLDFVWNVVYYDTAVCFGGDRIIVRDYYKIEGTLYREALSYADSAKQYTSNRHDFHAGGLDNKKQKMFEGKLGEKAVKILFRENGVSFEEDPTSCDERDEYDFLLINDAEKLKVDVKTRTEYFHTRTLEMVEQAQNHPKDIFISVRLYKRSNTVKLLGWFTYADMIAKGQIENHGYLDNYVMYDKDLRPIATLERDLLCRFMPEK